MFKIPVQNHFSFFCLPGFHRIFPNWYCCEYGANSIYCIEYTTTIKSLIVLPANYSVDGSSRQPSVVFILHFNANSFKFIKDLHQKVLCNPRIIGERENCFWWSLLFCLRVSAYACLRHSLCTQKWSLKYYIALQAVITTMKDLFAVVIFFKPEFLFPMSCFHNSLNNRE